METLGKNLRGFQNVMKNKPEWLIPMAVVVLILLGLTALIYALYLMPPTQLSEHTQLYKYKVIKNHWWRDDTGLVEHFPPKLPDDASDIHLYYCSPELMAPGYFQLRVDYSDKQKIQTLYDTFYKERLCLYQKGKGFYDQKDPEAYFDVPDNCINYFLSDDKMYHSVEYPPGLTIIFLKVFEAGKYGNRWNHGDLAGVAINQNTGTLVYFAKIW
jgi:hypothetical protein